MFLATQYYRPPFPTQQYWSDDFSRIRDAGLQGVQLWCIWSWVENRYGEYNWDDYDELISLAESKGLKVILSTIAEIHPFWIHRVVPNSELIDHLGRKVVSCCRRECNVGLTPGGCIDHPNVLELISRFLNEAGRRYSTVSNFIGWDCWNETRWCVQTDGYVCFCKYTLSKFRNWLKNKHGDLAGLNIAWNRRYESWDDVYPGKLPKEPYTASMEFGRFLVDRSTEHIELRYNAIRSGGAKQMISAHCGMPSIQSPGWDYEQTLCRGDDWDLAAKLDGFGCSHFPFWGKGFDDSEFAVRLESTRSANQNKIMWVSELQGGSSREGIIAHEPVSAMSQQKCVISSMSRGAKGIIFWSWRDEVFGVESSGFGLNGWDGMAGKRLSALKKTSAFIEHNQELITNYKPEPSRVGILFVPDNFLLNWSDRGVAREASDSIVGYAKSLEYLHLPYDIINAKHLESTTNYNIIIMPWCLVLPRNIKDLLLDFVSNGGRILMEAETDSFNEMGIYNYPDERYIWKALGINDLGRRPLEGFDTIKTLLDEDVVLELNNFVTPLEVNDKTETLARGPDNQPLLIRQKFGNGVAFIIGSFLVRKYMTGGNKGLERFVKFICNDAEVFGDFTIEGTSNIICRYGYSGESQLMWLINAGRGDTVSIYDISGRFGNSDHLKDLYNNKSFRISSSQDCRKCEMPIEENGFAVLKW